MRALRIDVAWALPSDDERIREATTRLVDDLMMVADRPNRDILGLVIVQDWKQ